MCVVQHRGDDVQSQANNRFYHGVAPRKPEMGSTTCDFVRSGTAESMVQRSAVRRGSPSLAAPSKDARACATGGRGGPHTAACTRVSAGVTRRSSANGSRRAKRSEAHFFMKAPTD